MKSEDHSLCSSSKYIYLIDKCLLNFLRLLASYKLPKFIKTELMSPTHTNYH